MQLPVVHYVQRMSEKLGMKYLDQPRGEGTAWVFRMATPVELLGLDNPFTGRLFGKMIRKGLGTKSRHEAQKRRDAALGVIRRLQYEASTEAEFSLSEAMDMRSTIEAARASSKDDASRYGPELVLTDILEAAERRGVPRKRLQGYARVATGEGYPLKLALPAYIEARRPDNPSGYKPLSQGTVKELKTAVVHLRNFLGDTEETACLEDVTQERAQEFRRRYLPSVVSPKTHRPMSARTADKYITMLRPLWSWAIEEGFLSSRHSNTWAIFGNGLPRASKAKRTERTVFTPEQTSTLLQASPRGRKGGDLIRLGLVTGARINELVLLRSEDVAEDCRSFSIPGGKTENAARFIPLCGEAVDVLSTRLAKHGHTGRVFPEWSVKDSTGKAGYATTWFTTLRRKVLGRETDGQLTFHSFRHTWRTVAGRARVPQPDIRELGGWSGARTSDAGYDHGATQDMLRAAQESVWEHMLAEGYLSGY